MRSRKDFCDIESFSQKFHAPRCDERFRFGFEGGQQGSVPYENELRGASDRSESAKQQAVVFLVSAARNHDDSWNTGSARPRAMLSIRDAVPDRQHPLLIGDSVVQREFAIGVG